MYLIVYHNKITDRDDFDYASECLSLDSKIEEILKKDGRIIGIYKSVSLNDVLLSIVCRRDK